jgi:hypothetical protein
MDGALLLCGAVHYDVDGTILLCGGTHYILLDSKACYVSWMEQFCCIYKDTVYYG